MGSWADAGEFTGLAAVDAICRARATAAGLANAANFKAWLSDSSTDAISRITTDGPWVRLDGVKVANSKADLVDGSPFTFVNLTETGIYHSNYNAWTGTRETGLKTSDTCNDWKSPDGGVNGNYGRAIAAGSEWSNGATVLCNRINGLN